PVPRRLRSFARARGGEASRGGRRRVNSRHARSWLEAAAACDERGSYEGPLALAAAVPRARWEGAVRGDDPSAVRLIAWRSTPWTPPSVEERRAAASALCRPASALDSALDERARLSDEEPWLDVRWDARARAWRSVTLGPRGLKARPF